MNHEKHATPPNRVCPVDGCAVVIKRSLLMCPEHWGMCPKPLRSVVWRWYRPGLEKRGDATENYLFAAHEAIQAVNKLLKADRDAPKQTFLL